MATAAELKALAVLLDVEEAAAEAYDAVRLGPDPKANGVSALGEEVFKARSAARQAAVAAGIRTPTQVV